MDCWETLKALKLSIDAHVILTHVIAVHKVNCLSFLAIPLIKVSLLLLIAQFEMLKKGRIRTK